MGDGGVLERFRRGLDKTRQGLAAALRRLVPAGAGRGPGVYQGGEAAQLAARVGAGAPPARLWLL
ncbi:MAG: hypothetical protein K6T75_11150, partial [Acetobacteraceae bacterium]|nr:hypothetical protein [Acetobacteraceae bacterium]